MKPLTREWVAKAEADLTSARREHRARKAPNYDAACFFAQQAVEKYLKARLQEASTPFGKTHDLEALLDQLRRLEPAWLSLLPALKRLSAFAVVFRYPGRSASKAESRDAIHHAAQFCALARESLGLTTTAAGREIRHKRAKQRKTKTANKTAGAKTTVRTAERRRKRR